MKELEIITDAPFYDGRNPLQTAADIVEQTGFFSDAEKIINQPYRGVLDRYQTELDNWRYRVGAVGSTFGLSSGLVTNLVYLTYTHKQSGVVIENFLIAGGILFGLATAGYVIGEVAARIIAKNKSRDKFTF